MWGGKNRGHRIVQKREKDEKRQESASLETELSVVLNNSYALCSAPRIIDLAYKGAEKHCQEMGLETCKWCAGVLKKAIQTMCVLPSLLVGNYLHISSRPTGLWSCSRCDLR